MGVFNLKRYDTKPVLKVVLKEPDPLNPGQLRVHDLTGSTVWKLHIWLSDGTKLVRSMSKVGVDADGTLQYAWITSDWDPVSGGGAVGGLVAGPSLPLLPNVREHRMEYEVLSGSTSRFTFPNGGANAGEAYDVLRIWEDIGQG